MLGRLAWGGGLQLAGCCECGDESSGSSAAELVGHRCAVAVVAGLARGMLLHCRHVHGFTVCSQEAQNGFLRGHCIKAACIHILLS
jgi:hypothetical protein